MRVLRLLLLLLSFSFWTMNVFGQAADSIDSACNNNPLSSACATACSKTPDTAVCSKISDAQNVCAIDPKSAACITALGATSIPNAVCTPPNDRSTACQAVCAPLGSSGSGLCTTVAGDIVAAQDACKADPLAPACEAACKNLANVPLCGQLIHTQQICKNDKTSSACLNAVKDSAVEDAVCKVASLSQACQVVCTASPVKMNSDVCKDVATAVADASVCKGTHKNGGGENVPNAESEACKNACKNIQNTPICFQVGIVHEPCKIGVHTKACKDAMGAVDSAVDAAEKCKADPNSVKCKAAKVAAKTAAKETGILSTWLEELLHVAHEAEQEGGTQSHEQWKSVEERCGVTGGGGGHGPTTDGGVAKEGLTSKDAHKALVFIATREDTLRWKYKGDYDSHSSETVTLEERMHAAMVSANMFKDKVSGVTADPDEKHLDYQNRGELLVKHPLSVPINLAVWCIAVKAQELLPMFCSQAIKLFTLLLILEFTWMGIQFVIKAADLGQIIDGIVTKMHIWTFSGCLIISAYYGFTNTNWMYSVFSSMNQIGEDVVKALVVDMQKAPAGASHTSSVFRDEHGNEVTDPNVWLSSRNIAAADYAAAPDGTEKSAAPGEALSPGSYFAMCILVISSIWSKITVNFSLQSLLFIPVALFVTPIILVSFLKMAADIALTMLEGYLALGLLVILVAFSACRWGSEYFQKAVLYCVMMGFKLICMYTVFIVGVRMMSYVAVSTWYVKSTGDYIVCIMTLLAMVMLISFIFQRLGAMAMGIFGGSPILSFGQLTKDTMDNASGGAMPFRAVGKLGKYSGKAAKWSGKKLGINNKISAKYNSMKNSTKGWAKEKLGMQQSPPKPPKTSAEKKAIKEKKAQSSAQKKEVKEGFKGMLDDTPSGGNQILPSVSPPGDD